MIVASDASTSFGLGVSVAELGVDHVRRLARLDTKAGDHVVLDGGGAEPDADRLGEPHDLGLSMDDFTTVLCVRAPEGHINMELWYTTSTSLASTTRPMRPHGGFGPRGEFDLGGEVALKG